MDILSTGMAALGAAIVHGPALAEAPAGIKTLVEVLQRAARQFATQGIFFVRSDGGEAFQSYAHLMQQAEHVLGGLRALGLKPGEFVLLQLGRSEDFIKTFWGCVLGGFIPVAISVPPIYEAGQQIVEKLKNTWLMLDGPVVVAGADETWGLQRLIKHEALPAMRLLSFDGLGKAAPDSRWHVASEEDTALMLLTSGSTSLPKGVLLSHRNVIAHARLLEQFRQLTHADVTLNWMPIDHVGGIVDFHVRDVFLGANQVQVASAVILQSPLRLLDLFERHKVSVTWAPNFAFALVNQALQQGAGGSWDLSKLRFIINAGEQVIPATVRHFLALLRPYLLAQTSVHPAYGMSELASGVAYSPGFRADHYTEEGDLVEVGPPSAGVSLRIVDPEGQLVSEGVMGHLQVRGPTVMKGYHNNPAQNQLSFTADGWFRTGDLALLRKGSLVITGRDKEDILIHGQNYPSHAVESVVDSVADVLASYTAACGVRRRIEQPTEELAVFFVAARQDEESLKLVLQAIRREVTQKLGIRPRFLLPVSPSDIPKTALGKIQRRQLRQALEQGHFDELLQRVQALLGAMEDRAFSAPRTETEKQIAKLWESILAVERVGLDQSFFDLGGQSIMLVQMFGKLHEVFGERIALVDLFEFPTVAALAAHIDEQVTQADPIGSSPPIRRSPRAGTAVAVVGLSCRFPGACTPDEFWQNLRDGVETVSFFSEEETLAAGVPAELARRPDFVRAAPILKHVEDFDAGFFGITPRDAEAMDPQHRLFLECAWEAMEDAGYAPGEYPRPVGVYAGAGMNTYLANNLLPAQHMMTQEGGLLLLDAPGGLQLMISNDKDHLPSRVSFKLNLRGPSLNVQTACSTSLVTIHLACQSLLNGECDMALAGGVSVKVPQKAGYLYQEGMIVSSDGHCRAFSDQAQGTVFGNGCGVVLLKPLEDAVRDGDHVYAVIKGSAINNDGGSKMGYMAPSQSAGTEVVLRALAEAEVPAETVTFLEAHGTGTALGDPIEVAAFTQAFRQSTPRRQFCALGSVKTNVGHLQIASGVTGFMKAVLALYHRQIPPTLHFQEPNPQIPFEQSPFFVNSHLMDWAETSHPRRAGVHALAVGGTNAHAILEEAPPPPMRRSAVDRPRHIMALSGRTPAALRDLAARYLTFVEQHPELELADLCFTTTTGRRHWEHRLALPCSSLTELREALQRWSSELGAAPPPAGSAPKVALVFSGHREQYEGMGQSLYETHPGFRALLERCQELFLPYLEQPLLAVMFPELPVEKPAPPGLLAQPLYAEPALFALGYALASLWLSWGIRPSAVFGLEAGEYTAACVAGVLALEDAVRLVAYRARLLQAGMNGGGELSEAAGNESGPVAPIPAVTCKLPKFSLVASSTGSLAAQEVAQLEYWTKHPRRPPEAEKALQTLAAQGCDILIEIGPKATLLTLRQRHPRSRATLCLATLEGRGSDWQVLLQSLSQVYELGAGIDWKRFDEGYPRRRVSLPTYAWQRQRYWIDAPKAASAPRLPGKEANPLLGTRQHSPRLDETTREFAAWIGAQTPAYLQDHRIGRQILLPAVGVWEIFLSAAIEQLGERPLALRNIVLHRPLVLESAPCEVRTILERRDAEVWTAQLWRAFPQKTGPAWVLQAEGELLVNTRSLPPALPSLDELRRRCPLPCSVREHYASLAQQDVHMGPSFQTIRSLSKGEQELLVELRPAPGLRGAIAAYQIHPALWDGALHSLRALMPATPDLWLTSGVDELRWFRPARDALWVHVRAQAAFVPGRHVVPVDITLFTPAGECVAELRSVQFTQIRPGSLVVPRPTSGAERSEAPTSLAVESASGLSPTSDARSWDPGPAEGRPARILMRVHRILAERTGVSSISENAHLIENCGLESLARVDFRQGLSDHFGIRLSTSFFRDYPTLRQVADYLLRNLAPLTLDSQALEPDSGQPGATAPPRQDDGLRLTTDHAGALDPSGRAHDPFAELSGFTFLTATALRGRRAEIDGHWYIDYGSCNYLGLDWHPDVIRSVTPALERWGVHPPWTRFLASPQPYAELESKLAELVRAPYVDVFPTVTLLNMGLLSALLGPEDTLFIDQYAHNCLQQAAALCHERGTEIVVFRHNDVVDLERRIALSRRVGQKVIAVDGVYSLDGTHAPLPELARLSKKHRGWVMVDDSHGFGILGEDPDAEKPYGKRGNGIVRYYGLDYGSDRIIYVGQLSKAYSTMGGFVAYGDPHIQKAVRRAFSMIFSGPLPTASLATGLAGLEVNEREGEQARATILARSRQLTEGLHKLAYTIESRSDSSLIRVTLGEQPAALDFLRRLTLNEHIIVTPAIYPAVEWHRTGLRFMITALHTTEDITDTLLAMERLSPRIAKLKPSGV